MTPLVAAGNTSAPAALLAPNGGEVWTSGLVQNVTWDTAMITGTNVNLYVLHDDPISLLNLALVTTQGDEVNKKNWYQFATNIPNTGSLSIDPALLNGVGNAYMVLIVSASNNAVWDVSNGMFTLL